MSDEPAAEFTPEQITEHAQGNLTAFILTTFAYLKDRGLSTEEFVRYVGQRFAPSWDEVKDHPLPEITRIAALNIVSSGARLRSISGDDTHAEAVVSGWPSEESRSAFGLTMEDLDPFWNIYQPVADYLRLKYSWERQDDAITLRFTLSSEA